MPEELIHREDIVKKFNEIKPHFVPFVDKRKNSPKGENNIYKDEATGVIFIRKRQ